MFRNKIKGDVCVLELLSLSNLANMMTKPVTCNLLGNCALSMVGEVFLGKKSKNLMYVSVPLRFFYLKLQYPGS